MKKFSVSILMLLSSVAYAQTGILADDHMVKLVETKFGIRVDSMNFSPGLFIKSNGIVILPSDTILKELEAKTEGKDFFIGILDLYEAGFYGSYGWGIFVMIEPNYDRKWKKKELEKILDKLIGLPLTQLPLLLVNQEPIKPEEILIYLKEIKIRDFSFIMDHPFVNQQLYPGSQNGLIELVLINSKRN